MKVYPITNILGETIGRVALEDDKIPVLIMEGQEFKLGGEFYPNSKQFLNFIFVPVSSGESDLQEAFNAACAYIHSSQDDGQASQQRYDKWMVARKKVRGE